MHASIQNLTPLVQESESACPIVSIRMPPQGELRIRKVVTRSRARGTGKYPSWKMRRMLQWESPNERDTFRLLDASPEVKAFSEQPLEIQYRFNEEVHRHYPDILVCFSDRKELWEVKPSREASRPDVAQRTALLTKALPKYGYFYRVIIAEDLRREPRRTNIATLLDYGKSEISEIEREKFRLLFSRFAQISWGDVVSDRLGLYSRNHVCRLILEGVLTLDFDSQLTYESVVSCTANKGSE